MSETLRRVQTLVLAGEHLFSSHSFDELAKDDILPSDVIAGVATATAIEDYPDRTRGPSVLVLQHDRDHRPIHIVWGLPAGLRSPAVVVTAYRPDPAIWGDDFEQRI